jgi:hypothetical protein
MHLSWSNSGPLPAIDTAYTPPSSRQKQDRSSIDHLGSFPASQESILNSPGPKQISKIKKSTYRTSGR